MGLEVVTRSGAEVVTLLCRQGQDWRGQSYLGFRMLARALVEWEVTVRGVGWGKVARKGGWVQVICEAGEDLTCLDADLTSNGKKAFTSSVTNYSFLNTYFSTSTNKE